MSARQKCDSESTRRQMWLFIAAKWPTALIARDFDMNAQSQDELADYRVELRAAVCAHCIERRSGEPPCGEMGGGCGIELHLGELVEMCRTTDSALIDPYIEKLHETICAYCERHDTPSCPCPLDYLLQLAVESIERVERRRAEERAQT
jgi:hypothetical protein